MKRKTIDLTGTVTAAKSRPGRTRGAMFFFALIFLLLTPKSDGAEKSWFTGITKDGQTRPISAFIVESTGGETRGVSVSVPATPTLIDMTISIYDKSGDPDYPDGDDDGNTQGNAGSEEQDVYEHIIQFMAEGIYESTEGAHKLRNVRIFKNGKRSATSDIVWAVKGHPKATFHGIAGAGGHIYMYDIFEAGSGGSDYNLLADKEGAGYTMAHEMGHYFYGVLDEYPDPGVPTDVGVVKSMMNNHWNAKGGDYDWLNFSIKFQAADPNGDWINNKLNRQHRTYAESAWETIARNPVSDPKTGDLNGTLTRKFYSELGAVAPTGTNAPTVELTTATANVALSDLNIIWAKDDIVYEIILDKSGSMGSAKMADAKTAAKLLVDKAEFGKSKIGMIAFNSSASILFPITDIDTQATKDSLKAKIDTVFAGGGTAIGLATQVGLSELLGAGATDSANVAFMLTDGISGDNALIAVPDYQAAQIPIFTFAFGSGADTTTLGLLATQTGGQLFISPTTLAAISAAFDQANQSAAGLQGLSSGASSLPPALSTLFPFQVDSTVGRIDVTVVHDGVPADATVTLTAPDTTVLTPLSVTQSGAETALVYGQDMPQLGEWVIAVTPNTTSDLDFSYQVNSVPTGTPYSLSVSSTNSLTLTYPAPLIIVAVLEQGIRISNAQVSAVVTAPDGTETIVDLDDDGVAPDEIANDGRYTALFSYDSNGTYEVQVVADNFANTATLTSNGSIATPTVQGLAPTPLPDVPVGEVFERASALQVTVSGASADDHGDTSGTATSIATDNSDTPGRLEAAGDIDFFSFVAPADSILAVRVSNLALGINPILTVFDTDGTTVLDQGDLSTNTSAGGYVVLNILVTSGMTYFASVTDIDTTALGGLYAISVGSSIISDLPAVATSSSSGGLNNDSPCVVATAAYGTPMESQINVLREVRDTYLLNTAAGTAFVEAYYIFSPPLADFVAKHPAAAATVRVLLTPVIAVAGALWTLPLLAGTFITATVGYAIRRRRLSLVKVNG